MGVGEGSGENRTVDAIKRAVSSPLLDTTIENATSAILNFEGGDDLGLTEIYRAADLFKQILAENANIIFGLRINSELKGRAVATVIATGFDMPQKAADGRAQKAAPPTDGFKPFGSQKPQKGGDKPVSVPPNAAFFSDSKGFETYVEHQKTEANDNIRSTRIDADIETLPKWLKDKLNRDG
jgi:cell division protein FtsZ